MPQPIPRREALARGISLGALAAGAMALPAPAAAQGPSADASAEPFLYCLNTSTVRGQELGIVREVEIAAEAGYRAVEPWMRDLDRYVTDGGSLADLRKRIADLGLSVESAIGFGEWIVDDPERRGRGLEQARRDMDTLAQIGGIRIAAPPTGATDIVGIDLFAAAERYRELLEVGAQMGVVPQVEVWGFSKTLSRLGETVLVAIESRHPQSCVLPDVYHLYKGGSDFTGLKLLGGAAMHVFHINDYPASPDRADISDADRVYPGDGVAPLDDILRGLAAGGFRGALSLELFNRDYWQHDALLVARTGLEKMRDSVARALA